MSYFKPDGSVDTEAIERHLKACQDADKTCLYHPSSQEEARRITQAQMARAREMGKKWMDEQRLNHKSDE